MTAAAPLPLANKVALVTGAASGIGRASALALADQGAQVALLDRDDSKAVLASIEGRGGQALALQADIGSEDDVQRAFAGLRDWRDRLDIVVNCAGIVREQPLLETSGSDFDKIIGVNLRGTFLVGREGIRLMRGSGRPGRVINVASELAYLGRAEYSAYCASKAAVLGLTRVWAREFAPDILVNSVAPGPTDTAMMNSHDMSEEWLAKESDIPLGRIGQPEEIASVIAFLAGPGASFITGQAFGPNGGAVMP